MTTTAVGLSPALAPVDARKGACLEKTGFSRFLQEKSSSGFTFSDSMKYQWIRFSSGFESLLCMVFGARKVENKELEKEIHFYNQCLKIQDFYSKFQERPADNYKDLKKAFEELRGAYKAEDEQCLNAVLMKTVGVDVAKSLLEYCVERKLTKEGNAFSSNLREFYFQHERVLEKKEGRGYAAKESIRGVFGEKLRAIVGEDKERNEALRGLMEDASGVAKGSLPVGAAVAYERDIEVMLKGMIQSGKVSDKLRIRGFSLDEQKELLRVNEEFAQLKEKKARAEREFVTLKGDKERLTREIQELRKGEIPCSYETLRLVVKGDSLSGKDKEPEGFEAFYTVHDAVVEGEKTLTGKKDQEKLKEAVEELKGKPILISREALFSQRKRIETLNEKAVEELQQVVREIKNKKEELQSLKLKERNKEKTEAGDFASGLERKGFKMTSDGYIVSAKNNAEQKLAEMYCKAGELLASDVKEEI